ncbi:MAG: hypothetical protein ACM3XO_20540 [Bacteroidota bacterium]
MNIPSTGNVYFFETQKDIDVSGPYATISAEELGAVIQLFATWRTMLTAHPIVDESIRDAASAHIQLTADLQRAITKAQDEHTYPNVILPMHTFITAMKVMSISRAVVRQPEFGAMLAEENRKWEATPPYGSVG